MIAINWLLTLSLGAQFPHDAPWRLPVTITVLKDVPVEPHTPNLSAQKRGTIWVLSGKEGFVIKKGQTFEMTKIGQEGGCWIQFGKKEFELSTCPWLGGFRDHQTDVFTVSPQKRQQSRSLNRLEMSVIWSDIALPRAANRSPPTNLI